MNTSTCESGVPVFPDLDQPHYWYLHTRMFDMRFEML